MAVQYNALKYCKACRQCSCMYVSMRASLCNASIRSLYVFSSASDSKQYRSDYPGVEMKQLVLGDKRTPGLFLKISLRVAAFSL